MWGKIWELLSNNTSSIQPGFFTRLGDYAKSDQGRQDIATYVDQSAAASQQANAQAGAAAQQAAQSIGMGAMTPGNTIQPAISSTPIGMTSNYDPEKLKRLMRLPY